MIRDIQHDTRIVCETVTPDKCGTVKNVKLSGERTDMCFRPAGCISHQAYMYEIYEVDDMPNEGARLCEGTRTKISIKRGWQDVYISNSYLLT